MRSGSEKHFFDFIDRKRREKEVLGGQIARLEMMQQGVSCWSNVWGVFDEKIKVLRVQLIALEQEIQAFTERDN